MEKKYYPTIGLEIHAELKTQTKMFCGCKNNPDEENPNVNICPICMAHPGTLPVINKKAVENVIKVGLALGGNIADFTEFDRKNYFYPDIPKGFQISQYKYPIVFGGRLADFDVTRVHLEEDTANNKHINFPEVLEVELKGISPKFNFGESGYSLVDFNRSGVPLMELVTEPHTFDEAETAVKSTSNFAKELQLIFWYLGISEANMEKGEMRVEANISVSEDKNKLGIKVEVKNLNSFKSVEKAIKFELGRITELLENGNEKEIVQETRGWDEGKQKTFSQRKKESSQDYRYFPEPDLSKMKLHEAFDLEKMKKELQELPQAKRLRYKNDFGIKDEDIENIVSSKDWVVYFEELITKAQEEKIDFQKVVNYFVNDYVSLVKEKIKNKEPISITTINPLGFVRLIGMVEKQEISSRVAKDVLKDMFLKNMHTVNPLEYIEKKGLLQKNDEGELKTIIEKIVSENPEVVAVYKSGKENAIMSLVGKVIKESKGSANPQLVIKILKDLLK